MKIKDFAELKYGKDKKFALMTSGDYPILGTGGIIGSTGSYLHDRPSVLLGRKGSIELWYIAMQKAFVALR